MTAGPMGGPATSAPEATVWVLSGVRPLGGDPCDLVLAECEIAAVTPVGRGGERAD